MPANTDSWAWKFRQRWMTDAFDAVVALRLQEWELIDAAVLAQTADWAREAQATHQEEFGFVVLDGTMRLLARSWGDPPVTPELAATVARYLSLPPDDELADAAEPLIRELVPDVVGLLESIKATLGETARGQSRRVLGAIALRLAVPRVQLLRMARRLTAVPAAQTRSATPSKPESTVPALIRTAANGICGGRWHWPHSAIRLIGCWLCAPCCTAPAAGCGRRRCGPARSNCTS